ncbi:DUF917 domain-containing protein [Listeria seeligeri]|uniref:DUF917 domain-containing protein n=2 Tax=Listeria seeligeri TaxID=1640 RepID=A0ABR5E5M6_LISSE|nr:DUF917 domain-containing protein [Listeria seeligeri]EFS01241.1 conserved hypothetical protein [Listeria seeligeri FSL N1-067]KKD45009.1 hypothetical protein UQ68_12000 [Listeria seeligeri]MBC1916010.1 DUF917 domain-containing protein [Listeria seeligeri]MBC2212902.1 DUF917 domain-containing protein [Listeria seeligeri]MBF2377513.1 DUF917 domain-containing protein [Listeria seeligeri]
MRYLDEQAIENIAIGAAFLGTGGGGDPYIGKMMALTAIKKYGPVKLLSPEEIADDDYFIPAAMMGAPSVLIEKFPKGDEFVRVFEKLGRYLGKEVKGTFPMEAGGVNSMIPIVVAAQLGLPLIDCDGMGRAFPELQMVTFHLDGISATPMAITDEKGNIGIMETIDNKWTERLARVTTVEMGASSLVSLYPCDGAQIKQSSIKHIVTLSEEIGKVIRETSLDESEKLQQLLDVTKGYHLFEGKITDVVRETRAGFNFGRVRINGLNNDSESEVIVHFQNENLVAEKNGQPIAITPDLICMVDLETLMPVTTEALKYGKRVRVMALPADDAWRTAKGIETVGPRYFGYDVDFAPLEELVQKEERRHV